MPTLVVTAMLSSFLEGRSVLNFPRLSFQDSLLTGIAVSNPTGLEAELTITAYSAEGRLPPGINNPVRRVVPAGSQLSVLTSELFGAGLEGPTVAWFQATSPVDGLAAFFLYLDSQGTFLDGGDLPESSRRIIFPQILIDPDHASELNLVNPGSFRATVQLQLISPDSVPLVQSLTIPSKGVVRLDASSFFEIAEVPPGTYVVADSDVEIAGFEFVEVMGGDLRGLAARSSSDLERTLYFPQMVVLGGWKSELGLVNYSSEPTILTLSAYQADGSLYGSEFVENNPVTRVLAVGESLLEEVAEIFGFSGTDASSGWLQVESSSGGHRRVSQLRDSVHPGLGLGCRGI